MDYPSKIRVGQKTFPIEYSKVMKGTSSVRIAKGKVILRLSRYAFPGQRDEMVAKFLKWAEKKLSKTSVDDFVTPVYKNGGRICMHNRIYDISVKYEDRKNNRVVLRDSTIEIFLNKATASEEIIQKIKEKNII